MFVDLVFYVKFIEDKQKSICLFRQISYVYLDSLRSNEL